MALISNFSRLSFNLLIWFFLNGVIFLAPGLSWIKYPILLNIEALCIVFVFSCIYDAAHWRPWQEAVDRITALKGGDQPRKAVIKDFRKYMLHFGLLALVWSLEILFQKLVFSTVFTSTIHYIDHDRDPLLVDDDPSDSKNDVPLACMDGTLLFSIRQMAIVVALFGTLALDWQDPVEIRYLFKASLPVFMICVGAFLAVWNNQTSKPSVGHIFLAIGWIFLRSFRLVMTKWVQMNHMHKIPATRFLRLLLPLMFVILVPGFLIFEAGELHNVRAVLTNSENPSDADLLQLFFGHIGKVLIYSILFFSSLMLLLNGGNSVDYTSWLMLREVIWNTACSYAVGTGELTPHILGAHQIVGLVMFLCSWVTYIVLFLLRFVERNRQLGQRYIRMVTFKNHKEVDLDGQNADPLKERVFDTQRFSDDVSFDE